MDLLQKVKDRYLLRVKHFYICSLDSGPTLDHYALLEASRDLLTDMYNRHRDELSAAKYALLGQRIGSEKEQCLLIRGEAGELMGYCHTAYQDHYNSWSNLQVKLKPNEVYFFDDYIFKPYRGRGLHKFSISQRKKLALAKGYRFAITLIDKSNIPSRRAYAHQGFVPCRTVWHLPLLKRNILWCQRVI